MVFTAVTTCCQVSRAEQHQSHLPHITHENYVCPLLGHVLIWHACLQEYCTNNPDEISRVAGVQRKVDEVKNSEWRHPL